MDERLRDLERRWRNSGSLQAEREYVAAAIRSGRLAEEAAQVLRLIAHPAIVDDPPPTWCPSDVISKFPWEPFGRELHIRMCLAAGWLLLPLWTSEHPDDDRPRRSLEAIGRCVLAPSDSTAEFAELIGWSEEEGLTRGEGPFGFSAHSANATFSISLLLRAPRSRVPRLSRTIMIECEETAADARAAPLTLTSLGQTVTRELGTWLLGAGDPIRSRSEGDVPP